MIWCLQVLCLVMVVRCRGWLLRGSRCRGVEWCWTHDPLQVTLSSCCCDGKVCAGLLILCCCVCMPAGHAVVELLLCGGAVMFSSKMMMHTTPGLRGPRWSVSCLLQGSEDAFAVVVGELMSCSATISIISAYILAAEGHGLLTWRSHSVVNILAGRGHLILT